MTDATMPRRVIVYARDNGKEPFTEWIYGLRDAVGRRRILARVSRLQHGNYGDCEPVGEGVSELRLFFGGDKGSQSKDIEQAKAYWKEYLSHEHLPNDQRG